MLPAFDIAIDKLRIQAARKEAARIASDLQHGGWSVGDNDDWLFIRELNVSSPKNGLRLNASREIRNEIGRAVHGGSDQAAHANAVRFFNFPDLLAFLLRDIVSGRQMWFWKKWMHFFLLPKPDAVTQLLWNNITELASIVERLAGINALPEVWRQLSVPRAEILLVRLAEIQHLSTDRSILLAREGKWPESAEPHGEIARIFNLRKKTGDHWRNVFSSSPTPDARFYLAALAMGVGVAPQAVARRPEQVIAAFYRLVVGENSSPGDARIDDRPRSWSQDPIRSSMTQPSTVSIRNGLDKPVNPAAKNEMIEFRSGEHKDDSPLPVRQATEEIKIKKPAPPAVVDMSDDVFSSAKIIDSDSAASRQADSIDNTPPVELPPENPALEESQFYTCAGGVFYLINAINHPESHALLRNSSHWRELASGWPLVYCLAKQLNGQMDTSLLHFFATIQGLKSISQLDDIRHPELVDLLFPLFKTRYEKHLEWDAKLLPCPARVVTTYSHVDVFYDMSAIRLPVRLCGLDVNPGWIPWLGRVIKFHYRDEAVLRMGDGHG